MMKFQGVDYYSLDGLLSEEEILVRNTIREFVDDNILHGASIAPPENCRKPYGKPRRNSATVRSYLRRR